ncbi:MAG: alternative ribosome rescue aminoacyl-tRNA hydrolase ArfB [Candidatus Babeliales bacterium]|nr:alternative ribosome rescue aminoacyl-tRNA hydrolase ArfB [Candidatus Babeliales bacterium]
MRNDVHIQNGINIPGHELIITASRSSGPGGQKVNKSSTKVTVRWNVKNTSALNDEQKSRVISNLQSQLTIDGDLIINSEVSRSQYQNREMALQHLAEKVQQALFIPKKRKPTKISRSVKESRLQTKKLRSSIKKMRSKKFDY